MLEAVITPYEKLHKDMQKESEKLHIIHFFTKFSLSTVLSALLDHHDNFQPAAPTSFQ
jgi:hypothetical protein